MRLLDGKTAVIYGAAGNIGTAVSKAFAKEGATVILAGRTMRTLESLASDISKSGGIGEAARVDALDSRSVEEHLHKLVAARRTLDVSFNLMATSVAMGSRLDALTDEQFMKAAFTKVRSQFITATSAARVMQKQGKGVILALTTPNARLPMPNMGGFSIG